MSSLTTEQINAIADANNLSDWDRMNFAFMMANYNGSLEDAYKEFQKQKGIEAGGTYTGNTGPKAYQGYTYMANEVKDPGTPRSLADTVGNFSRSQLFKAMRGGSGLLGSYGMQSAASFLGNADNNKAQMFDAQTNKVTEVPGATITGSGQDYKKTTPLATDTAGNVMIGPDGSELGQMSQALTGTSMLGSGQRRTGGGFGRIGRGLIRMN